MTPTSNLPDTRRTAELLNLLAAYLANSPRFQCPGCDGMMIEDIVSAYPEAAAGGSVPSEAELCDRHPQLTSQVVAFFFLLAVALNPRDVSEVDVPSRQVDLGSTPLCLK